MLAWIRSPRGSTATATAVAVILALFWYAPWQKPLPITLPFASSPSATGDSTSPAGVSPSPMAPAVPTPPAVQSGTTVPPAPGAPAASGPVVAAPVAATPPDSAAAHPAPTFDVVRVQPGGDIVIAGRGEAGADVDLMDGNAVVGHGTIDASGQFALLPPALGTGSHYLTLRVQKDGKTLTSSSQSVAVTIVGGAGTKPLVALLSPDKPTQVISDGSAVPPTVAPGAAKAGPAAVAIQTVEASQGGKFLASGVARAGSQCHIYLNGAYLADVTAGQDGHWSVEVKKGMAPGRYTVRADEIDPANGKVVNRAEVPFDYPATLEAGKAKDLLAASASPEAKPASRAPATPAASSPPPAAVAVAIAVAPQQPAAAPAPASMAATPVAPAASGTPAAPAAPAASTSAVPAASAPPAAVASAPSTTDVPAASDTPSPSGAVIADLSTTTVIRGDSLWRISRKMLGHGIKYTEIYASNASQIRDPRLIYPGQVFVVPVKPPT